MLTKDFKSSTSADKVVVLEGKGRLPSAIQDMILDFDYALTNIQNPLLNSNELLLITTIKNFAGLDFVLENSMNVLNKTLQCVERMHQHNSTVEKCINQVENIV